MNNAKIIAVDFDGTLVENKWPEIGAPIEKNIAKVKAEQEAVAIVMVFACVELVQPIADFLMSQNFFVHCDPPYFLSILLAFRSSYSACSMRTMPSGPSLKYPFRSTTSPLGRISWR